MENTDQERKRLMADLEQYLKESQERLVDIRKKYKTLEEKVDDLNNRLDAELKKFDSGSA